jgi:hypothetical protein
MAYSFRNASTGFIRAALHAGKNPDVTPVIIDITIANAITGIDIEIGKYGHAPFTSNVSP